MNVEPTGLMLGTYAALIVRGPSSEVVEFGTKYQTKICERVFLEHMSLVARMQSMLVVSHSITNGIQRYVVYTMKTMFCT